MPKQAPPKPSHTWKKMASTATGNFNKQAEAVVSGTKPRKYSTFHSWGAAISYIVDQLEKSKERQSASSKR